MKGGSASIALAIARQLAVNGCCLTVAELLLEQWPMFRPDDLHALATQILGRLGSVLHLPAALAPAPVHDGLVNTAFLDAALLGGFAGKCCGHSRATGQFDEVAT